MIDQYRKSISKLLSYAGLSSEEIHELMTIFFFMKNNGFSIITNKQMKHIDEQMKKYNLEAK